jgi:hypothetical protein
MLILVTPSRATGRYSSSSTPRAPAALIRFDAQAFGVSVLDHPLCDGHVLLKGLVAGIDHHRAVKARLDAIVTGGLVAVVEVHGKDGIRVNFLGLSNDDFQHPFVGVFPCAFRKLNDEGSLRIDAAFEQAQGLLQVVDVVGADGVLTVSKLKEI